MTQESMSEHAEYLDFAKELARKGGEMMKEGQANRFVKKAGVSVKASPVDFVTEVDEAVEKMIRTAIAKRYPSHQFLGEEGYASGEDTTWSDEWTWIVDPIDGTNNFVHGFPYTGCSVGLAKNQQPVLGAICMPFLNQLFWGAIGGGAYVNGDKLPLHPQPLGDLSACMVNMEVASDRRPESLEPRYANFKSMLAQATEGGKHVHGIRMLGASVGSFTALALGQTDVYWDAGSHLWDTCAAMVILKESGCYITGGKDSFQRDLAGQPDDLGSLMKSRRYTFVRAVAPSETETSLEIQKRIAKEITDIVEEWTTISMLKGEL